MKPTLFAPVLAAVLLTACSSADKRAQQDAAGIEDRDPNASVTTVNVAPVGGSGLAALNDPSSILSKRSVYFDFDSFVIRAEDRALIEAHARFLTQNPELRMMVQGNADERGSREYNLALGQKRADAVRRALTLLGATDAQIEAVSLGEEKPVCNDRGESCFAQNRRSDMLYTGEF